MIVAGLLLLSVGAADVARQYTPRSRRWVPLAALVTVAVIVVVVGTLSDALIAALLAVAVAAAWIWSMPSGSTPRAGLWPVAVLLVLCGGFIAALGERASAGVLTVVRLRTPFGDVGVDRIVLTVGAVLFLIESANVIVRAVLDASNVPSAGRVPGGGAHPATAEGEPSDTAITVPLTFAPAMKGGRVIGPVERLLVFALTLTAAYPLLAAVLAAKGIVRFPEISRDSAGAQAEYFLIGSLVSWGVALAAALAVWWALATA